MDLRLYTVHRRGWEVDSICILCILCSPKAVQKKFRWNGRVEEGVHVPTIPRTAKLPRFERKRLIVHSHTVENGIAKRDTVGAVNSSVRDYALAPK